MDLGSEAKASCQESSILSKNGISHTLGSTGRSGSKRSLMLCSGAPTTVLIMEYCEESDSGEVNA
jgi:hypothetical protein